ncbi:MAG: DUF2236 domain-containing protein [Myxococcales bacterium]|nr:DUF2236 domain-containing protein [Myxococcales bacterium]
MLRSSGCGATLFEALPAELAAVVGAGLVALALSVLWPNAAAGASAHASRTEPTQRLLRIIESVVGVLNMTGAARARS